MMSTLGVEAMLAVSGLRVRAVFSRVKPV